MTKKKSIAPKGNRGVKVPPGHLCIEVRLNGTDTNPFHAMGLTQNPFPQLGKAKWDKAERQLHRLGGDPIPHDAAPAYIADVLTGFHQEFIDLCIKNFR